MGNIEYIIVPGEVLFVCADELRSFLLPSTVSPLFNLKGKRVWFN